MKKTILLLISVTGLLSCSNNDDSTTVTADINNRWTLLSTGDEINPVTTHQSGEYLWNVSDNTLKVSGSSASEDYMLPAGTYNIVTDENSIDVLTTGYEGTYGYNIEGNKLYISPPGAEFDAAQYLNFKKY